MYTTNTHNLEGNSSLRKFFCRLFADNNRLVPTRKRNFFSVTQQSFLLTNLQLSIWNNKWGRIVFYRAAKNEIIGRWAGANRQRNGKDILFLTTYTLGIWILSTSLWRLQSCHERERDEFRCPLLGDMLDLECSPPEVGVRLPSSLPPWALLLWWWWCCCSDDWCSITCSPIILGWHSSV